MRAGRVTAAFLAIPAFVLISGLAKDTPTYSANIEPILRNKCVTCHNSDGAAPFKINTYDDARRRATLIRRMLITRYMPPCFATSDFGEFCDAPPVTDEEVVAIQEWIRAGTPQGEETEPIEASSANWELGQPDAILDVAANYSVPAEGINYWRAFLVPLRDAAGRKLQAFDVIPDEPQIVRHAMVAVARPGLESSYWYTFDPPLQRETDMSLRRDYSALVGSWAPGYRAWSLPEDVALPLPEDGYLLVQVQYIPLGRDLPGRLQLGLYYDDDAPTEPEWLKLGEETFSIPPNVTFIKNASHTFEQDTRILSIIPEAKFFTTQIFIWATYPDGERKELFNTVHWDPYWPGNYQWSEPPTLPAGTKVDIEFYYGSDAHSAANELDRENPILGGPLEGEELFWTHILTAPAARR